MREVDALRLIFIESYYPAFTTRINSSETWQKLSEKITFHRSVVYTQVSSAKRPDGHEMCTANCMYTYLAM
jgi:hypothetical protein